MWVWPFAAGPAFSQNGRCSLRTCAFPLYLPFAFLYLVCEATVFFTSAPRLRNILHIMPTSAHPSSHMPSHNAAVVIRERIKEKRLFEAQFLFGLLDEDDMPAQERLTLERELDGLLAVVRDLQLQANKYLAEGEHVLARKMHREMERIAIDVPGLEFGKRHIEEQDFAARQAAQLHPVESAPERVTFGGRIERPEPQELRQPGFAVQARQWLAAIQGRFASVPKGKLLLTGAILILLILSVLFLNLMRREYSDASLKAKAGEGVAIKPLSVRQGESSSVHTDEPSQRKLAPADAENPAVNIRIGTLSVESGSAQ